MTEQTRLKIAIQKSGRLTDNSLDLLKKAGIKLTRSKDQLFCKARNFPLDVFFVRDDDIPAFVATDVCQIGVVGANTLKEKQLLNSDDTLSNLETLLELGFGECRLSFAIPATDEWTGPAFLEGKRIATSYKGMVQDYLNQHNLTAKIVPMEGAVEVAPRTGMADVICDLVSTGATLASNGMKECESIFDSQSVLIKNPNITQDEADILDRLMMRIRGVKRAESSKYIMLHAPKNALEDIKAALPGSESPTVLNLQGIDDKVAIHAVCDEAVFWETMEELQARGASSILVLPIEKMSD